jgi:ribulose-phosphate 3-epimerase
VSAVADLRARGPLVSAGIATADQLRLGEELDLLAGVGIELVHLDVMDGVFCPASATASPALARATAERLAVDVHLMVDDPLGKVEPWVEAGATIVTFQLEGARHPRRVLQSIADADVIRGVAIGPGTPLVMLEPLLDDLELVLVVTVDPGWPGQRMGPTALDRLARARELVGGRDALLAIDGGVNRDNIQEVVATGPDLVVAGSAIFDGTDAGANARDLQLAAQR